MISIPYKAKQFLVFLAKLFIVGGALYFIYNQLVHNEKLDWNQFLALLERKKSIVGVAFILSLSFLNRFLEILKWQNLAQKIKPISLSKATEQVLAALTAGLFTPNGIGEYAGKALYFPKKYGRSGLLKFDLQRYSNDFECIVWNNWITDFRLLV